MTIRKGHLIPIRSRRVNQEHINKSACWAVNVNKWFAGLKEQGVGEHQGKAVLIGRTVFDNLPERGAVV